MMAFSGRCPVRKKRIGPPRKGLVVDDAYRKFVRTQPCACCGTRAYVEAAHVGVRGLGSKCSDRECLPLCRWHHTEGPECHHHLGRNFFAFWKLDRYQLIEKLNAVYENEKGNE